MHFIPPIQALKSSQKNHKFLLLTIHHNGLTNMNFYIYSTNGQ